MEVKGNSHVYECSPAIYGNDDSSVIVKLKCVPKPDFDTQTIHESTLAMEARRKSSREFVGKYFVDCEGYVVDGKELKTFDDIYTNGPGGDLYNWIFAAVMSREILDRHEIKN